MKVRTIAVNALMAALYIVITAVIAPFGFSAIQFRVSEIFNHLVVFNKKYFFGIVVGVFFANLFFSPILLDLLFGVGHTIISLTITILLGKYVKNELTRMIVNTLIFSAMMFIIAYELMITQGFPFFETWLFLSISELLVMFIGMPLMYWINKRIKFARLV